MAWKPSITFLLVASSTSNAGTICPAASGSIFTCPCVSLSTRSVRSRRWSCSVMLAGQVDCTLTDFGAWAKPFIENAQAAATTNVRLIMALLLASMLAGLCTASQAAEFPRAGSGQTLIVPQPRRSHGRQIDQEQA